MSKESKKLPESVVQLPGFDTWQREADMDAAMLLVYEAGREDGIAEGQCEVERLNEDITMLKSTLLSDERQFKQWEKRNLELRNDLIETAQARDLAMAEVRKFRSGC